MEKTGVIEKKPIVANTPTSIADRVNEPVAYSLDFSSSLLPCKRPIVADVPITRPMVKLMTVNVTGKVKLIAAKGSVPRRLTKKVSIQPKLIIMTMPKIIGIVIRFNVEPMSPSNKLDTLRSRWSLTTYSPVRFFISCLGVRQRM